MAHLFEVIFNTLNFNDHLGFEQSLGVLLDTKSADNMKGFRGMGVRQGRWDSMQLGGLRQHPK